MHCCWEWNKIDFASFFNLWKNMDAEALDMLCFRLETQLI